MSDTVLVHKISWRYAIEPLSGKEDTYILRRRDGLILAFIEARQKHIISLRSHENRKISLSLLAYLSALFIKNGYSLSEEVARFLGISVLRGNYKNDVYLSFKDLCRGNLPKAVKKAGAERVIINGLKPHNLVLPKGFKLRGLDLLAAKIKSLMIGRNVSCEIDARGNHVIKNIRIDDDFAGKLILTGSSVRSLSLGNNAFSEVLINDAEEPVKIKVGNNYQGGLDIRSTYLRRLNIGNQCGAHISMEVCVCYQDVMVGNGYHADIKLNNVFARRVYLGNEFSGYITARSANARYGIRKMWVGDDFSGHIDFSSHPTIEQVNVGRNATGVAEFISCPELKLVKFDSAFSGEVNLSESGIVYVRAYEPCSAVFNCQECKALTLLKMPLQNPFYIVGAKKPLAIRKKGKYVFYILKKQKLSTQYFSSVWKRIVRLIRQLIS